jgi:hypothetical protein
VNLPVNMELKSDDPIDRVAIIKNGAVVKEWSGRDIAAGDISLGSVNFKASGWFLVRVIADVKSTFRFASTAPYYVELGDKPRLISRASVDFFQSWVAERISRIKIDEPKEYKAVMRYHKQAQRFWQDKLERANAE